MTFVPFKDINLIERRKHLRFGIKNPFNHFRPMFTGFKVTETLAPFEWHFVYSRHAAEKTFLYLFIDEILFLSNIG